MKKERKKERKGNKITFHKVLAIPTLTSSTRSQTNYLPRLDVVTKFIQIIQITSLQHVNTNYTDVYMNKLIQNVYHSNIIQSTNPHRNNRRTALSGLIHHFPLTPFCFNAGRV